MHDVMTAENYFAKFPEFRQSQVAADENRLHQRYNKLIRDNAALLRDARVLDLGSHDGRWSIAALEAGARSVKGLEGRAEMAEQSRNILAKHNVPEDCFSFEVGDFHTLLRKFGENEFDVVLCLGILYHTPHNVLLFQQMSALSPKAIILDTEVCHRPKPVFHLGSEGWRNPSNAIREQGQGDQALFCVPSHAAIELMTAHIGYKLEEIDWHDGSITDWMALQHYRKRTRRSYVLLRMEPA